MVSMRQIKTAAREIAQQFRPQRITLFGSYAYGTPHRDSDIDLIVIVEESSLSAYARDAIAYRALG